MRDALSQLCQNYWRPIFAFICHRGYSVSDAQDLTQDFFLTIIEGALLERADPESQEGSAALLRRLEIRRGEATKLGASVTSSFRRADALHGSFVEGR